MVLRWASRAGSKLGGRPPPRAPAGAVLALVRAFRNGVPDPSTPQAVARRGVGVGLIGQQPDPAPTATDWLLVGPVVEQRNQLRIVTGLTGGEPQSHRPHLVVDQRVDLGGEPAPGPAQGVVVGLRPRNSATRDGRKLVAVVLGEQSLATRRVRATDLLENGFKRYFWKSMFGTSINGLAIQQASLTEGPAHLKDAICGVAKLKPSGTRKARKVSRKGGTKKRSTVSTRAN